jgi:hypothetical protein
MWHTKSPPDCVLAVSLISVSVRRNDTTGSWSKCATSIYGVPSLVSGETVVLVLLLYLGEDIFAICILCFSTHQWYHRIVIKKWKNFRNVCFRF